MGMTILLQLEGHRRCHRGGGVEGAPGKMMWITSVAGWVELLPGVEVMCVEWMRQRRMVRRRSKGRQAQTVKGRKRVWNLSVVCVRSLVVRRRRKVAAAGQVKYGRVMSKWWNVWWWD